LGWPDLAFAGHLVFSYQIHVVHQNFPGFPYVRIFINGFVIAFRVQRPLLFQITQLLDAGNTLVERSDLFLQKIISQRRDGLYTTNASWGCNDSQASERPDTFKSTHPRKNKNHALTQPSRGRFVLR